MPPVGFKPTVSAGERPQTYALDRAATGTVHLKTNTRRILTAVPSSTRSRLFPRRLIVAYRVIMVIGDTLKTKVKQYLPVPVAERSKT